MNKALGAALALGMLITAMATTERPAVAAAPRQPNVVVILTDDMRLDDLRYMRFTRRLFRAEGTTFTHVISPHPLCCPARAEMATGQYAQTNGVHHNTGPHGGWPALRLKANLVHGWFQDAGYATGFMGKFINLYQGGDIPGLTQNDASSEDVYQPYDITTWNNGSPTVREGHQTDWVAQRTAELVHQYADRPFFLWASYLAPHIMKVDGAWASVPPERYTELRHDGDAVPPATRKESFRERDVSDKPRWVQQLRRPSLATIQSRHLSRVLALYAVDDAVRRTVRALKDAEEYADTVLVFTSDNGIGMGEHRMLAKNHPYQEALRVPFLMTGPGVPRGVVDDRVGTLVDLPATISALAGVTPGRVQDGTNLFTAPEDRAVLIQGGARDRKWAWRGVYTSRYTLARHTTGEVELYDRRRDPEELTNVADARRYRDVRWQLTGLFRRRLEDCAGTRCVARAPG